MGIKDRIRKGALTVSDKNKKNGEKSAGTALRRAASNEIAVSSGRGASALTKVAQRASDNSTGNIGFIVDATASRERTWKEAQRIQRRMFEKVASIGSMQLRLVHFGGFNIVTDHKWCKDADTIAGIMAEVRCDAGMTQIVPSLLKFIDDDTGTDADSIILVGDSFEEKMAELAEAATALKAKNIKVYAYLEGDSGKAEEAFRNLAEITNGEFAKFGSGMPLEDLVVAAAIVTIGGKGALNKLTHNKAVGLLTGKKDPKKDTPKPS